MLTVRNLIAALSKLDGDAELLACDIGVRAVLGTSLMFSLNVIEEGGDEPDPDDGEECGFDAEENEGEVVAPLWAKNIANLRR